MLPGNTQRLVCPKAATASCYCVRSGCCRWTTLTSADGSHTIQGGGGYFAGGIFRCGKFRISNVCEISRSIFRPLCEINPVRNLATGAHSLPLCSLAFELLSVERGWRRPRNPDSLPGWRVSIRPQSTRTSRGGGKAPGTQGSGSGIKESQIIRELVFVVPQSR